ncbi:MAG: hypothetical protein JNL74_01140 [Fibrobacteres bacterium]|nr:hypothetical protein [Fibrobacterota bacterium]
MRLIILLLMTASLFSKTAQWSDSVVTQGMMTFIPDAPAVTVPLPRVVLDTTPMNPDDRFLYDNLPESKGTQHGQIPLFLKRSVNYITGIPEKDIPQEINVLPFVLLSKGYRIFKLTDLQAKAAQLLIANGIPILAVMQRIDGYVDENNKVVIGESGSNVSVRIKLTTQKPVSRQKFYTVIKGFSPVERGAITNSYKGEQSDLTMFYTYDDYAFKTELISYFEKGLHGLHRIVNGYQSEPLNERASITEVYIIVQKEMTLKRMKKKLAEIYDQLPQKFGIPEIEEVEDRM